MAYRKRLIQIAGISAAAGFAVAASPGVASASSYGHGGGGGGDHFTSMSKGSHIETLESKYGGGGSNLTGLSLGGLTSGSGNLGVGNSGSRNIGVGNSGCGNIGVGNSGNNCGDETKVIKEERTDYGKKVKDCGPKAEKPKEVVKVINEEKPEKPEKPIVVVQKEETPAPIVVKTEEVKPEVVYLTAPAPAPAPAPVVVKSAQLAHTGVNTAALAGLGTGLIGLGIAMERAGKRKERRTNRAEGKGSPQVQMAALGEKFEDKNKLVVPLIDIDANTAAWPMMVGA